MDKVEIETKIKLPMLIKELELEYQRISDMINYVDNRSNVVVAVSGALFAFIVAFFAIFAQNILKSVDVSKNNIVTSFELMLIMSLIFSMIAIMIILMCMYPRTYRTKGDNFEYIKNYKELDSSNIKEFWTQMTDKDLLTYRLSLLNGQHTVILRKLNYLKYSLNFLFLSIISVLISFIFLFWAIL